MGELTSQVALLIGVVACFLAGPVVGLLLVARRRRIARTQRRSPIGIDLLRGPGHSLREQIEEVTGDMIFTIMLLTALPMVVLAIFLAQSHLRGLENMTRLAPIYGCAAIAFLVIYVRKLLKSESQLDNLRAGYDAEVAVGQELDQLMRKGAVTFHDVPAEGFNIDHVVVSREGLFAVETKGFTKPNLGRGRADATVTFDGQALKFPTYSTIEPLEQAERQAKWLSSWLTSAAGMPVRSLPVIALPGWFVQRTGRGVVRVFSGRELNGLLNARGTQPLTDEEVQRLAHQLDQRCRTVTPKFKRAEEGK